MGRLTAPPPRLGALAPKLAAMPKQVEDFYSSPEWRSLMKLIKLKRGNRCARPGCGSTHRVIGDHIVERKDGGADLDEDNIELLCPKHHAEKTARARAKRARGERPQGDI
jgi:5-methylcytosine-specific restriction endonuclease McrA